MQLLVALFNVKITLFGINNMLRFLEINNQGRHRDGNR